MKTGQMDYKQALINKIMNVIEEEECGLEHKSAFPPSFDHLYLSVNPCLNLGPGKVNRRNIVILYYGYMNSS